MSDPTPGDVLREAAAILERDGWEQGTYGDESGPNCIRGAINRAAGCKSTVSVNEEIAHPAYVAITRHIHCGLELWNDAPGRTQAEVVKALLRAADDVEFEAAGR